MEIVQLLLNHGAPTEDGDVWEDRTPLFVATMNSNLPIMRLLLYHGANINATTTDGITSLSAACYIGNIEAVQLLLSKGANSSLKDKQGQSALDIARKYGNSDIVRAIETYNLKCLKGLMNRSFRRVNSRRVDINGDSSGIHTTAGSICTTPKHELNDIEITPSFSRSLSGKSSVGDIVEVLLSNNNHKLENSNLSGSLTPISLPTVAVTTTNGNDVEFSISNNGVTNQHASMQEAVPSCSVGHANKIMLTPINTNTKNSVHSRSNKSTSQALVNPTPTKQHMLKIKKKDNSF